MSTKSPFNHDQETVLIASDHPLIRTGLAAIARLSNLDVLGEAETLDNALALIDRLHPSLLILDISLRNGMGIGLIQQCKARNSQLKILVLSAHDEWLHAGRALQAGALGYLNRSSTAETIADAVRNVTKGQVYLSPEVTGQMQTYRERIKTKLNVKNGAELTYRAIVWVLMNQ